MTSMEFCEDVLAYEQLPLYSGAGWEIIQIICFTKAVIEGEITVDMTLEAQLPSFSM